MSDFLSKRHKSQEREFDALNAKRNAYYRDAEYEASEKILQEKDYSSSKDDPENVAQQTHTLYPFFRTTELSGDRRRRVGNKRLRLRPH